MEYRTGAEEFVASTLDKLPGLWARLSYVSHLRAAGRQHSHWGLEQTYGVDAAHEILASMHTALFNRALTSSVARLIEEAPITGAGSWQSPQKYFEQLHACGASLAPQDVSRASLLHFELVLDYLTALVECNVSPDDA